MGTDNQTVVETTPKTFQRDVFDRSMEIPVIVDFWAPWCAPCRQLGPVIEEIARARQGLFVLVKAPADDLPEAPARFGFRGIPAVFFIWQREIRDGFQGNLPRGDIERWCDRLLQEVFIDKAREQEARDPQAAGDAWRTMLVKDPDNLEASIGLARVLLATGEKGESRAIIERLCAQGCTHAELSRLQSLLALTELESSSGELTEDLENRVANNPNDFAAKLSLAKAKVGSQSFHAALDLLIDIVARDRQGVGVEAKNLMVHIFKTLPPQDELVSIYQRRLATLLY